MLLSFYFVSTQRGHVTLEGKSYLRSLKLEDSAWIYSLLSDEFSVETDFFL